jgi:hypothetical protein
MGLFGPAVVSGACTTPGCIQLGRNRRDGQISTAGLFTCLQRKTSINIQITLKRLAAGPRTALASFYQRSFFLVSVVMLKEKGARRRPFYCTICMLALLFF